MKLWRPKDPKAVALIRLTLWSGLVTWMVFTLVIGISMARLSAVLLPSWIGSSPWLEVLLWVVPVWIIFVTLMLIWAVARYANNKLRRKEDKE